MKPTPVYSNLILLTMIPFIVGDLYFAYRDYSCSHLPIENTHIAIDLGAWLKVSGYTNLAYIILPILSYYLAGVPRLLAGYLIFAVLYTLFRFAWLIVGSVMFWGYLWKWRMCADSLGTYMWVNLIYGMIMVLILCYLGQQTLTVKRGVEEPESKVRI